MRIGLGAALREGLKERVPANKTKTNKSYKASCNHFQKWVQSCKDITTKQVLSPAGRSAAIQSWVDYLQAEGKTPATIHTYAAGVCCALGVPMEAIKKPSRAITSKVKSKGTNKKAQKERQSPKNERLVQFAEKVGIRRAEYKNLSGCDFMEDEQGQPCVYVRKGKGGKAQLQVIAPEDKAFVSAYFDGSTMPVFNEQELYNDIDLHGIRAEHAKKEYQRYNRIASTPEGRKALENSLLERFEMHNKAYRKSLENAADEDMPAVKKRKAAARAKALKKAFAKEMQDYITVTKKDTAGNDITNVEYSPYRLRGANKVAAHKSGLPTEYSHIALLAVSVFALSHWRNEVAVKHYMI